jgi:hypothetical protein
MFPLESCRDLLKQGIFSFQGGLKYLQKFKYFCSVADPDPGSGAFLTPGPGSGIPTPYFLELSDKFLGKKFYNSLKTGPNFFLQHL